MAYLKGLGPVEDATANTIPNTLTTQTGGSMEYEFAKLEVKHFVANTTTESSAVMGEADQYPSESESEDEQDVAKKTPKLSEKRRAQNMKFSAWSAITAPMSWYTWLTVLVGYRIVRRRSQRKKYKLSSITPTKKPSRYAASWQSKIQM